MTSIRSSLSRLWTLRRSPNHRIRQLWWTVVLGSILLTLAVPTLRHVALGLWLTWNFIYAFAAVAWSMFHLRALLHHREEGMRWAVWLTLLSTVLIFSLSYGKLLEQQGGINIDPNVESSLILLIPLLVCPALFFVILSIGWIGGAVGAFAARQSGNHSATARSTVRVAYGAVALLGFSGGINRTNQAIDEVLLFSLPLLTVGFYRLPISLTGPIQQLIARLLKLLDRGLQQRRVWRGRTRAIDLRGAMAGLLAAVLMLITPTAWITPLKTLALVTLIQSRAALYSVGFPIDVKMEASRDRIVILDMDQEARRQALAGPNSNSAFQAKETGSETMLQANVIDRLRLWGALAIVLPLPTLHASAYQSQPGQPAPDASDISRSRRQVIALAAAMRKASNVVLTLPPKRSRNRRPGQNAPDEPDDTRLTELTKAASAVSVSSPARSSTADLPMIPTHWDRYVPVPIVLAALASNRKITLPHASRSFDLSALSGSHIAQVAPDGALINFVGQGPQRDFVHVSYTALLHDEPIYLDPENSDTEQGHWIMPGDYFHGRMVFLDALSGSPYFTPIGMMPRSVLLAYGTATLLSGDSIRRVSPVSAAILALMVGLYVGATCFRRAPIDTLWRAAIPILIIMMISFGLFIFEGAWLDPVVPLGAAIGALGFVSQFTFTRERAERQRTRALFQRFVAPQMVDDLLSRPESALGLGGKRQTVCVLFADVRNFTRFAEFHEADKVIEVINIYMSALTERLHQFDGVLDKYTGDGLMAWFPVAPSPGDDVGRAVKAALAMRDAAIQVSERMPPDERLDIGIGLHYGDAVVGLVGCEDLQVNWTALGYTVVVSARLQTIAAGGEVVISEQVYLAISDAFEVIAIDPVQIKGSSTPIRPYRVIQAMALAPAISGSIAATVLPISSQDAGPVS